MVASSYWNIVPQKETIVFQPSIFSEKMWVLGRKIYLKGTYLAFGGCPFQFLFPPKPSWDTCLVNFCLSLRVPPNVDDFLQSCTPKTNASKILWAELSHFQNLNPQYVKYVTICHLNIIHLFELRVPFLWTYYYITCAKSTVTVHSVL